jgi:hypothetical protein
MAVHPPDVCYPGAGFESAGAAFKYPIPGLPGTEFWAYKFQEAKAPVPVHLRLLYSHSADRIWKAADNPRVTYARVPVLFKMYVSRMLAKPEEPLQDDPSIEFIRALHPELQKTLFSTP